MTTESVSNLSPVLALTQQVQPFSFAVKDIEKLATKVNGAAQYIFKVQFRGDVTAQESDKPIVAIPLHSVSMTKAVMMLEALGRQFATMGSKELLHEVEHLGYSAVSIERKEPSKALKESGYQLTFDRYDEKIGRFASSPHINTIIEDKRAMQLERYARELEKKYGESQIQPQLTLEQKKEDGESSSAETSPTVELTRRQSTERALEDNELDLEPLHSDIIILCLRNDPDEVSDDEWEKKVKPYDKIFGEGFMEEVKTQAKASVDDSKKVSLEELLTTTAYQKAQEILREEEFSELKKCMPRNEYDIHVRDFILIADTVEGSKRLQK